MGNARHHGRDRSARYSTTSGGRPRRGGGRGRGRGRAGRGDVRAAILLLLAEQPMHGYQIIQEVTERSSGAWTPSPGAVYPAIGLLTDEGLVSVTAESGRNLATLTDEGSEYVQANTEALGQLWDEVARGGRRPGSELRRGLDQLHDAIHQVVRVGSDEQAAAALAVLEGARREVYLILAAPPADEGASAGAEGSVGTRGAATGT